MKRTAITLIVGFVLAAGLAPTGAVAYRGPHQSSVGGTPVSVEDEPRIQHMMRIVADYWSPPPHTDMQCGPGGWTVSEGGMSGETWPSGELRPAENAGGCEIRLRKDWREHDRSYLLALLIHEAGHLYMDHVNDPDHIMAESGIKVCATRPKPVPSCRLQQAEAIISKVPEKLSRARETLRRAQRALKKADTSKQRRGARKRKRKAKERIRFWQQKAAEARATLGP